MTKFLSPIRSLDVSAELLESHLKSLAPMARRELRSITQTLYRIRKKARRDLPRIAKRLRSNLLIAKPKKIFRSEPAAWFLASLSRQLRGARNRAARALLAYQGHPDIPRLHAFRICLKKYRYLLEIQAETLGRPEPGLETLKTLQDHIGAIHDLEVLRHLLQDKKMSRKIGEAGPRRALAALTDSLTAEVADLEKSFLKRQRRALHSLFPREVP